MTEPNSATAEIARLRARVDELLRANNQLVFDKRAVKVENRRLRVVGNRAVKAIEDFIDDLRMRAGLGKRNIDPDGVVSMPVGIGVLRRLQDAQAALQTDEQELIQ